MFELIKRLIRMFEQEILIVGTQSEMESLISQNARGGIWLAWEVLLTKEMDDSEVKAIHQTKTIFPGTIINYA